MAHLDYSSSIVTESSRLSSTSNNKEQFAPGMVDTSTDYGNEKEMAPPLSGKASSSRKITPVNSKRPSSTSNNKEQTAIEMVDTSTDNGNEKEKLDLRKAERDLFTNVEYRELIKAIKRGDVFKINEIAVQKYHLFGGMSRSGNTILHIAVKYKNWLVVSQIIKRHKSLIYTVNDKGETPLHIAAKHGNVVVVFFLVFHHEKNRTAETSLMTMKDEKGNTPLHNAVRHGHELIAEILIESDDTSVLEDNDSKQSPLSIAIDGRLKYIARFIIEKELSSPRQKGDEVLTPLLHSAIKMQEYDIVVDIFESNKDTVMRQPQVKEIEIKDWNPLHYAAASGHVEIARYLSKVNPLLVYQTDKIGQTPLHLAAMNDRPGVLKMLLNDYPDSTEMTDNKKRNILHVAAENGKVKIVSFILRLPELEDLVNSGDKDGNTPLHLAAMQFQSDVVYIFSKYKNVDIRAINGKHQTALEIVQTSRFNGKEIQTHLTTKALKAAYAKRGMYEDIKRDHRGALPERSKSAPEVLEDVAHQQQTLDTESMPVEHTRFAGVEDIDGEGGCRGKEMAQTLSMMNTLIATFTFTAAFTIPGGFRGDGSNEGMAVLARRTSFKAFVITDTISMSSSMTAAVIVFWSFWCSKSESFMDSLPWAIGLTWIGLISMTLAFVTGLYVVLSENMALAIAVSTIGCVFPLIFYIFAPIISLLSGQSAHVHPFAFSFKMVKIFLKKPIGWYSAFSFKMVEIFLTKPIGWCFNCLSRCSPTGNKTYLSVALIHKILFGIIYYWIMAFVVATPRWMEDFVIALPRWIKEFVIALPRRMKALVTAISNLCTPRH